MDNNWKEISGKGQSMHLQGIFSGVLFLEKMGADFSHAPELLKLSDVNNHRVRTWGEAIRADDQKNYFMSFGTYEKYNYRTTHKRTGKPLKHSKKELENSNALSIDMEYTDSNGCWRPCDLERALCAMGFSCTQSDILRCVNAISVHKYNRIIFADPEAIPYNLPYIIRSKGGFRENEILRNLAEVERMETGKEHKVYRYISTDGNSFEYDFVTKRICG